MQLAITNAFWEFKKRANLKLTLIHRWLCNRTQKRMNKQYFKGAPGLVRTNISVVSLIIASSSRSLCNIRFYITHYSNCKKSFLVEFETWLNLMKHRKLSLLWKRQRTRKMSKFQKKLLYKRYIQLNSFPWFFYFKFVVSYLIVEQSFSILILWFKRYLY